MLDYKNINKVVLATGNKGKVKELAVMLSDLGIEVLPQSEFAVTEVAETGSTFVENAIIKARHAAKHTGLAAVADDSGLAVDALGGAPGVYSARYSGEQATDQSNIIKLLDTMADIPKDKRQAKFLMTPHLSFAKVNGLAKSLVNNKVTMALVTILYFGSNNKTVVQLSFHLNKKMP